MLEKYSLAGKPNIYAPGIFDGEVTLYRQQIRALNLAYLLHHQADGKQLNVGIVGAGGCGLTLCGALLMLGHKTTLYERQADPMYLQKGCETRYLHPNNYAWPAFGADVPFSDLPFMHWRAASATNVSRQIWDQFTKIDALGRELGRHTFRKRAFVLVNPDDHTIDWQSLDENEGEKRAGREAFDVIALCIGFGIENEIDDDTRFSYWRNDSFNQIRAGSYAASRTDYWVTGAGDGGLIDVQRLTIKDYDQSRFIYDVWGNAQLSPQPIAELRSLHKDVLNVGSREPSAVYDIIEANSAMTAIQMLDRHLISNRRPDTFVVLNSRETHFKQTLRVGAQSFLNALVTHRLYNLGSFVYHAGAMKKLTHPMLSKHHSTSKIIVRHGPNLARHLQNCFEPDITSAGSGSSPIERISTEGLSRRLWEAGWWHNNASEKFLPLLGSNTRSMMEFCSPDIQTIFEGYVASLSGLIAGYAKIADASLDEFRVCLHRQVMIQERPYYQQVTPYYGMGNTSGSPGRIFDRNSGIVGLAFLKSKTVIIEKGSNAEVGDLWKRLGLGTRAGAGREPPKSRIYLAVPLTTMNEEGNRGVSFVLYLDSSTDFFQLGSGSDRSPGREKALEFIKMAFDPFADNVSKMMKMRRAYFNSVEPIAAVQWPDGLNLFNDYPQLLTEDDLVLDLPKGASTEVSINRYREAGLDG